MSIAQTVSCLDGYDPDALRVDKAREAILACLAPITETRDACRSARRWGACSREDIVPRINVPGARQLGDGWLRGSLFRSSKKDPL